MALYANAREFLHAVEARYRTLSGYSDTGLSRSLGLRRPRLRPFETAFLAPGRFRFAFSAAHPYRRLSHHVAHYAVGTDGSRPYFFYRSYDGKERLEHPESLEMAVAGATGISSGTAHTIGALLFQEVDGFRLTDMRRVRFRPSRLIDGVSCIAVSGLHPWRGGRFTAWFGADDMLLRRLVHHRAKAEELRFDVKPYYSGAPEDFDAPRFDV